MPVLTQNGDAIAFRNAPRVQDSHHARDLGGELFGGDRLPAGFEFPECKLRLLAPGDREKDVVKGTETHCCARPKLYCFPPLEAIRSGPAPRPRWTVWHTTFAMPPRRARMYVTR